MPMTRKIADCECTLVFNGEIFNHKELRVALPNGKYDFQTASDTEVLLFTYMEWVKNASLA